MKRGRPPRKKTHTTWTGSAGDASAVSELQPAAEDLISVQSQHSHNGTREDTSPEISKIKQEPGHFDFQVVQRGLPQGGSLQTHLSEFRTCFPKTEPHCVPEHLEQRVKQEPDVHEVVVNGDQEEEDGAKIKLEAAELVSESDLRPTAEPGKDCFFCYSFNLVKQD